MEFMIRKYIGFTPRYNILLYDHIVLCVFQISCFWGIILCNIKIPFISNSSQLQAGDFLLSSGSHMTAQETELNENVNISDDYADTSSLLDQVTRAIWILSRVSLSRS